MLTDFELYDSCICSVKTPLVAAIDGGISRRVGWGANVTFDALNFTTDPDYPSDDNFRYCITPFLRLVKTSKKIRKVL